MTQRSHYPPLPPLFDGKDEHAHKQVVRVYFLTCFALERTNMWYMRLSRWIRGGKVWKDHTDVETALQNRFKSLKADGIF